ncbi:MAG: TlpA family protein disulfide reductase [Bacteroidales bacterium]
MRNTLVILFLFSISVNAFSNRRIQFEDKRVVLVTSVECGYCITNIAFYNQLSEEYKGQIQMVALSESSSKKINKLPRIYPDREVVLKNWIVVPNARKLYLNLIEYETFPQLIFIDNGIVVDRFVGTIESVKNEIRTQLPLFIKE